MRSSGLDSRPLQSPIPVGGVDGDLRCALGGMSLITAPGDPMVGGLLSFFRASTKGRTLRLAPTQPRDRPAGRTRAIGETGLGEPIQRPRSPSGVQRSRPRFPLTWVGVRKKKKNRPLLGTGGRKVEVDGHSTSGRAR